MSEWRDIPHYPYEVSDEGLVRRKGAPQPLCPFWRGGRKSYLGVALCLNSQRKLVFIHTLVAAAFLGPKPDGLEINHIDGVKTNNHVSNLEYVTAAENGRHAARLGLKSTGSNNPRSKLTEDYVATARRLYQSGQKTVPQLARWLGVTRNTMRQAVEGKTWRHVAS